MNKALKVSNSNKTLCLLANSKVGDLYGHRIVTVLKNTFGLTDLRLIGNGGAFLQQHGQKSIIDLEDLREKVLHLWRYNTKSIHNMKYSNFHVYQGIMLRMNNNLLQLVFLINLDG